MTRIAPGRDRKLSAVFATVEADVYRSGTSETPKPGSPAPTLIAPPAPASGIGTIFTRLPERTIAAFDIRKTLSNAGSTSLRGIGPAEASVTLPWTRGSTTKLSWRISPSRAFATVCTSAPSKFISTPSPLRNAACCSEADRISGSRSRCGSGATSEPGNKNGCVDPFVLPESPSFASGKRALKSVLRTESIASTGATPAVGVTFDAAQPPNARKIEATTQARGSSTRPHPCKLLTTLLLAVAPHDHIDGERPRTSDSESRKPIGRRTIRCLLIKSKTIIIDNNGHSASIVRRAPRYMRQSKDHFAYER